MPEIALFVEDHAHQLFLEALICRLSAEYGLKVTMKWQNVRRGHGAVIRELKQYLRDVQRDRAGIPDLVVVATDANCKGLKGRLKELKSETENTPLRVICAVPDPHIERWLLLDSAAFKEVFGRGCKAPDQKCERDRYKKLLAEAIVAAGIMPSLGGIEYADEIVKRMGLAVADVKDDSLAGLLRELHLAFRSWRK
jgi:hypothetical protein